MKKGVIGLIIGVVILLILLKKRESFWVYAMDVAEMPKKNIIPQELPESVPEANTDSFVNKFRYPSGFAMGECGSSVRDSVDEREILLTDGNGKPIEQKVRIAYPRVYGISGHENRPYSYQAFNNHCPCYPEKLEIDQLAGNNYIPYIKDICDCK